MPTVPARNRPFAFFYPRADAKALGHTHIHRKLNRTVPIIDGINFAPAGGAALISKFPYLVVSTLAGLESDEAKVGRSLKNESPLMSWLSWS